MIDWIALFGDALWIAGLAGLLALANFALFRRFERGTSLRQLFGHPLYVLAGCLSLIAMCLGLAANSSRGPWETWFWLALAATYAAQAWRAERQRRRLDTRIGPVLRARLRGDASAVLGLILLGVTLAALYAVTVRPWMQADEPRHFEVALHVARLGKPIVWYDDRVIAWEQEIITEMESQDFWWYGYSLIGWDPNNLPQSFNEIWGQAYGLAFYQQPLYYTLAGGWLNLWAEEMSLSQAVVSLRFLNVLLLAFSLLGIYKVSAALLPRRPRFALAVLAFAALWPSHLAANAGVNNDGLVELTVIWALFLAVRLVRYGPNLMDAAWLLVLGFLSAFTKRSGLNALALFPLALLLWAGGTLAGRWTRRRVALSALIALAALVSAAVLAVAVFRSERLLLPADFADDLLSGRYWQEVVSAPLALFASALMRTFMGWFGWLRVPLPAGFYGLGWGLLGGALAGLGLALARPRGRILRGWQKRALLLLAAAAVIQFGLVVGKDIIYGSWRDGSLPQARYLYPVLPAMIIPLLAGWGRLLPARFRSLPALIVILLLFNIYALTIVIYRFYWL